jgi:hypothetical protein
VHIELRFFICAFDDIVDVEELRRENDNIRCVLINDKGSGVFVSIELSFCICALDDIESIIALFMIIFDCNDVMFSLLLLSTTDLSVDMFNVSCLSKRSSCSLFLRNGIKRSPYIYKVS